MSKPARPLPGASAPPDQVLPDPRSIVRIGFLDGGPRMPPEPAQHLTEQAQLQLRLPPRRIEAIAQAARQPVAVPREGRLPGDWELDAECPEVPGDVDAWRRRGDQVPIEQDDAGRGFAADADVGPAWIAMDDRLRVAGQRGAERAGIVEEPLHEI